MKIGLSYSRCVRDIVEGTVSIDDVLVIIARTDFNPNDDKQWEGIWAGYSSGSFYNMNSEWANSEFSEQDFRDVTLALFTSGKLHQPRQFGAYPRRLPYYWLETVLIDDDLESKPAVKEAWETFQIMAGLSNVDVNTQA